MSEEESERKGKVGCLWERGKGRERGGGGEGLGSEQACVREGKGREGRRQEGLRERESESGVECNGVDGGPLGAEGEE
jgi:hypothetical protein